MLSNAKHLLADYMVSCCGVKKSQTDIAISNKSTIFALLNSSICSSPARFIVGFRIIIRLIYAGFNSIGG